MEKYEFTGEVIMMNNEDGSEFELKQIRSVRDFTNGVTLALIPAGTIGGWIQDESNLFHNGTCWLDEKSVAYGKSEIRGDAYVQFSCIKGDVIVEDKSYIHISLITGDALICGETQVVNCKIEGNSIVAGRSIVKNSELKNVRTLVGSSDSSTWKEITIEDSKLISEKHVIQITQDCQFSNVQISGEKMQFHAETIFKQVTGENIGNVMVEAPLFMEHVEMKPRTFLKIRKSKKKSILTGNVEHPICLDSINLILSNCEMRDSVEVKGKWWLKDTILQDFAVIRNEWTQLHVIEKSKFRDMSMLICEKDYSSNTVTASYDLSMEDCFAIV